MEDLQRCFLAFVFFIFTVMIIAELGDFVAKYGVMKEECTLTDNGMQKYECHNNLVVSDHTFVQYMVQGLFISSRACEVIINFIAFAFFPLVTISLPFSLAFYFEAILNNFIAFVFFPLVIIFFYVALIFYFKIK